MSHKNGLQASCPPHVRSIRAELLQVSQSCSRVQAPSHEPTFCMQPGGQLSGQTACTGLSVALFAPGWVYEGGGPAGSAWRQRDQELWDSLAAVLPAPRPAITQLPFASDFNAGYGAAFFSQARRCTRGLAAGSHAAGPDTERLSADAMRPTLACHSSAEDR